MSRNDITTVARDVTMCHHYACGVARWQPDARGRLGQAAMELYAERGYEQTTVADIAQRAGLTARTFFRYFADKREVLFAGSGEFGEQLDAALAAAPASSTPLAAVAAALGAVVEVIGEDRDFSRRRQAIIAANAELQERELIKLAGWSAAIAGGLVRRGVDEPTASLAAQTGIAAFRVAFERWLADSGDRSLADTLRDSFDQLSAVIATG
jgi:AcrR family transcriptional regulator